MRTYIRFWRRQPMPWCASLLLLTLLALLTACSGGSSTPGAFTASATPTILGTTTPMDEQVPDATNTPRPTATATPRPPTPTPVARPKPTATPRPPTPTPRPVVTINIQDNAFTPQNVTIHSGTIVKWVNLDGGATHDSTSISGDPASWSSPPLTQNESFTFTFTKTGTYNYDCSFHPFMTGTITVT